MTEKDPMRGHNKSPIFTAGEMATLASAIIRLLMIAAAADIALNKNHQEALEDFFDKLLDSF